VKKKDRNNEKLKAGVETERKV